MADSTHVEICDILDNHSRLAIASFVRPMFKVADIVAVFEAAFEVRGLPASILADNRAEAVHHAIIAASIVTLPVVPRLLLGRVVLVMLVQRAGCSR